MALRGLGQAAARRFGDAIETGLDRPGFGVAQMGEDEFADGLAMQSRRTPVHSPTLGCERSDYPTSVVSNPVTPDQPILFHRLDSPREPGAAQDQQVSEFIHAQPPAGRLVQVQEHVVPGERDADTVMHVSLENTQHEVLRLKRCPPGRPRHGAPGGLVGSTSRPSPRRGQPSVARRYRCGDEHSAESQPLLTTTTIEVRIVMTCKLHESIHVAEPADTAPTPAARTSSPDHAYYFGVRDRIGANRAARRVRYYRILSRPREQRADNGRQHEDPTDRRIRTFGRGVTAAPESRGSGSAGGAGDEGGDDVGGVAVEGDASSVVAHGGSGVGVGRSLLDVAERHPASRAAVMKA